VKIAIDARWVFPEISGVGAYTRDLVRHLARIDSDNEYVLLFDSEEQRDRVVGDVGIADCAAFRPLLFRANLFSVRNQLLLPRLLRRTGIDVYHSPNYMIPLLAFPRHRPGRTRCVITIHDVIPMLFPEHAPKARKSRMYPLYKRVMLEAGARADAIIAVSDRSRLDILEQLRIPPASAFRVRRIFNGVDERFCPPPGSEDPVPPGPDRPARLLYVGRSDPYKNLTGLIRSLAVARVLCPFPLQLHIVGPRDPRYPEPSWLAEELDVDHVIHWKGFLDDEALLAEYHQADLLVQPSRYEGFGLPVIEAMACGVPVVCSNAGSLPEVASGAALMVDPDDVHGLAEAIRNVLMDGTLAGELVQNGLRRATRFSWQRTAEETLAVYRETVQRGR